MHLPSPHEGRRALRSLLLAGLIATTMINTGCDRMPPQLRQILGLVATIAFRPPGMVPATPRIPGGFVSPPGRFPGSSNPGSSNPNGSFGPPPGKPGTGGLAPFDSNGAPLAGAEPFKTTLGATLYLPGSYRAGPARFLVRADWDRSPPTSKWGRARDRAPASITIHHTAAPATQKVSVIKDYHQRSRGWIDVAYHFLIRADGTIFEGRPLGVRGDHSGPNAGRIGICLIGSFDKDDFNSSRFDGARASLEHLLRALHHAFPATRGKIRPHGVEKRRSVGKDKVCPGPSIEAWGNQKNLWEPGYARGRRYAPGDAPAVLGDDADDGEDAWLRLYSTTAPST